MTANSQVSLSVIVPVYNVELYLDECLASLANQTATDIEVIIIDDGSLDSSAAIAKSYANRLSNFHYYYKDNGGLGSARNYGIARARGEYMTFCDSDDVIPENAYENMLNKARRFNSDIVMGNVNRFNSKKTWVSALHKPVFNRPYDSVTVKDVPEIIFDTISCNKLYKRSFWDSASVSFPEGVLYEDIPVVVPLLCTASSISTVCDICYSWRAREGADRSITQNRAEFRNLHDRIEALKSVDRFFDENVHDNELREIKEWKWLNLDLPIYINACPDADDGYFRYLAEYANRTYSQASQPVKDRLSVVKRLEYDALSRLDRKLLFEVIEYSKAGYRFDKVAKTRVNDETRFILKPAAHIKNKFDNRLFDITDNLKAFPPTCSVTDIAWSGATLKIEGFCIFPKVTYNRPGKRMLSARIVDVESDSSASLPIREEYARGVRGRFGLIFGRDDIGDRRLSYFNYSGSGFCLTIDFLSLDVASIISCDAFVEISVVQDGLRSVFMLNGRSKALLATGNASGSSLINNTLVSYDFDQSGIFRINSVQFANKLSCLSGEDANSVIVALCDTSTRATASIGGKLLTVHDGKICIDSDFVDSLELGTYRLLIDEAPIAANDKVDSGVRFGKGNCWRLLSSTQNEVCLEVMETAPAVSIFQNDADPTRLTIEYPSTISGHQVYKYLVALNDNQEVGISFEAVGALEEDGLDSLCFDLTKPFSPNNLSAGVWSLCLSTGLDVLNSSVVKVWGSNTLSMCLDLCRDHLVRLEASADNELVLSSKKTWSCFERTVARRRLIKEFVYPVFRRLPICRKKVVFEGLWGRKYYCNPRALYEYINEFHPEYKCIWSLDDERRPIKGSGTSVRRMSLRYFFHIATAKYLVNNVNFDNSFVKRDGQVFIETMHGMPLKTIGLDAIGEFRTEKQRDEYRKKCAFWDYVVVQNAEVEDIARRCYEFKGTFLRTGYPRNDILFKGGGRVSSIRHNLGLPDNKRVILYAPTWRIENTFDFHFDIDKLRSELSGDYVLLLRVHPLAAKGLSDGLIDNKFIFDVTNYPSTEELFLISDVAITDYSSLMFDYSILNKPMLFYVYDYESYRDRLRGLYYDLDEIAPGPLVKTQEELCAQLSDYDALVDSCRESIERFRNRFCTYERGDASERIFNQVFE